jgi:2-keto-myo-inositol isomerase
MQPELPVSEFLRFAADCGAAHIELRNDLADPSLLGHESPEQINRVCDETGVGLLTVNALQRFNDADLFESGKRELRGLMETAAGVGCTMIVLCPVNDPADTRSAAQQRTDLVAALREYAPLFDRFGMTGLVEPLGFSICSLRFKAQAIGAIAEAGLSGIYRIVHDTFHHYLSGEQEVFPDQTELIHVSGVHPGTTREAMTDDDRLFVDGRDVMDNRGQLALLYGQGFGGHLSFEPFSPAVRQLSPDHVRMRVTESMEYLFR